MSTRTINADNLLATALARLPHGPEFRFIDRMLSLDPGKSGVGEYLVRGDEPFLRAHFPQEPLFPGVLLMEAVAQLAGVVAQSDPETAPLPGLKLTGFRAVKITGSARPGETLRLEARVTGRLANLIHASATAWVKNQRVLRGELTLSGDGPRALSR
jgi:3-hydroxyacyl-[acyl-carrier-protein] dehydratase